MWMRAGIALWIVAASGVATPLTDDTLPAMQSTFSTSEKAALARGEVIVSAVPAPPAGASPGFDVRAGIRIRARPNRVFAILTDYATAAQWIPHLHQCRVIESAPDRSSELIEQEVDYLWLLPHIRYRFRAVYVPDQSIRFRNAGGDLRDNDGAWILSPVDGADETDLLYQARLRPNTYLPGWLYRRSLLTELPNLLRAIRARAGASAAG